MSEATQLLAHAERCFRLARGPVGSKLAEELEGLGHTFAREAGELDGVNGQQHAGSKGGFALPEAA